MPRGLGQLTAKTYSPPFAFTSSNYVSNLLANGSLSLNPINASQDTTSNGWQWDIAAGTSTATWNTVDTVTLTVDGGGDAVNFFNPTAVPIPTVNGGVYTITVTATGTAATFIIQAGTAQKGTTLLNTTSAPGSAIQKTFTATGTTSFINFSLATASKVISLSTISVARTG